MLPSYALLELLHESWREVLHDPECLDRNPNGRHSLRLLPRGRELRDLFLHGDVIRILGEEVRHCRGVLSCNAATCTLSLSLGM